MLLLLALTHSLLPNIVAAYSIIIHTYDEYFAGVLIIMMIMMTMGVTRKKPMLRGTIKTSFELRQEIIFFFLVFLN